MAQEWPRSAREPVASSLSWRAFLETASIASHRASSVRDAADRGRKETPGRFVSHSEGGKVRRYPTFIILP